LKTEELPIFEGCQDVKILSYNPGHDGAIAFLEDSRLDFFN